MAEQSGFDPKKIELQPVSPVMGLLEQFNLPPAMIAFIRKNQRMLQRLFIAGLVLALAVSAFTTYRDYLAAKAASALEAAHTAKQDNRRLLEAVADKYASTSSGQWAKIELALLDDKEGQVAGAITRLEAIRAELGEKSLLAPLVINKLAVLYEKDKQWDKALALYGQLASRETYGAEAYRAMGRVSEAKGDLAAAAEKYGKYMEMTGQQAGAGKTDPEREMVQARLNQIKK